LSSNSRLCVVVTCRSAKYGSRDAGRHARGAELKLDAVRRESPATTSSPRTRHVISHTRHGTAYRSQSPDDYRTARDDVVKWTIGGDYDSAQQQQQQRVVSILQHFGLFSLAYFHSFSILAHVCRDFLEGLLMGVFTLKPN